MRGADTPLCWADLAQPLYPYPAGLNSMSAHPGTPSFPVFVELPDFETAPA
jgi:hypothetical protein